MARRRKVFPRALPQRWLQVGSIVVPFAALTLLAAAFSTRFLGSFFFLRFASASAPRLGFGDCPSRPLSAPRTQRTA
jgi:hypothetical protein